MIDKKYHSKGFGTKVIGILVNIYAINYSIRAIIHKNNNPSLLLFKKNGFLKTKKINNEFDLYEFKY